MREFVLVLFFLLNKKCLRSKVVACDRTFAHTTSHVTLCFMQSQLVKEKRSASYTITVQFSLSLTLLLSHSHSQ